MFLRVAADHHLQSLETANDVIPISRFRLMRKMIEQKDVTGIFDQS